MIGTELYIKFGRYHGLKGEVVAESFRGTDTFYVIKIALETGENAIVVKKAKNTVRMI